MLEEAKNRRNVYKLELQELELRKGDASQTLTLEFDNHDDLFQILEKVKEKALFSDEQHTIEFLIGLKLLTEVMLKNKGHPLFDELQPAVLAFMKKLKSQPAAD